jgi:hypothetical protein
MRDEQKLAKKILQLVKDNQYQISINSGRATLKNKSRTIEIELFSGVVQNSRKAISR